MKFAQVQGPVRLRSRILFMAFSLGVFGGAHGRFPVIGYHADWNGGLADIQYSKLTHINYSFASTGADGGIGSIDDGHLRELVQRGHQDGTKVGVAVGGYGAEASFIAMCGTQSGREAFVKSADALCAKYGLDGIDIDWEYPDAARADDFASLMKSLGAALHKNGRYLSVAVKSRDQYMQDPNVGVNFQASLFTSVDFVNLMAYDGEGQNHSSYEMAVAELHYWITTRGCPKGKAILGVPFYGKARAPDGKETTTEYKILIAADRSAAQRDNSGNIYYNGIPTIGKKTQLANDSGGGIMIWEVGQDTHDETSLLSAIAKTAGAFPAVSIRAIRPQGIGGAGALAFRKESDARIISVTGRESTQRPRALPGFSSGFTEAEYPITPQFLFQGLILEVGSIRVSQLFGARQTQLLQ